jgi:hypothetical protein
MCVSFLVWRSDLIDCLFCLLPFSDCWVGVGFCVSFVVSLVTNVLILSLLLLLLL